VSEAGTGWFQRLQGEERGRKDAYVDGIGEGRKDRVDSLLWETEI